MTYSKEEIVRSKMFLNPSILS